jgi:SAM-dependent methyltransferase
MGYRKLHLFGYDSSHDNGSHAYEQKMNAGEPICKVTVFGKTFRTSWTMAKQAEFFPQLCDQLIDLGCVITVDGDGLLPYMTREIARRATLKPQSEREKYEAMWSLPEYREIAPGEEVAQTFIDIAEVKKDDVIIDFGCGTGRGAKRIHDLTGCEFVMVDFANNSLDDAVKADFNWYTKVIHDLSQPLDLESEKGYCTDVMEHIPPDQVDSVLNNVMRASKRVFFQISLIDDVCGSMIGQKLHLSVHPFEWWIEKFKALGYHVEWAQDGGESAMFYVANP